MDKPQYPSQDYDMNELFADAALMSGERKPRGMYCFSLARALGNWKCSFMGETHDEYGNIVEIEGYDYSRWLIMAIWYAWRDYRYKVSVEKE